MPATSEPQRKAAGAALAVKQGKAPASGLRGASKRMLSMPRSSLEHLASKPVKPQTTTAAAHLKREFAAGPKHVKKHRKTRRKK
ncbi:hypothetical protein LCGC14_2991970 [marine sediment metagenome]|uniref:DUF3008 domain-containing protein n=1 Tax=marine sediment metagenome TaxID=412755 RepID=A0A0F8ZB23_9ZZZZ